MAEFYRITRVLPNGSENIIGDVVFTGSDEQLIRASIFQEGVARSLNGQHIRLYSSDANGNVTPDDLIWDSEINLP